MVEVTLENSPTKRTRTLSVFGGPRYKRDYDVSFDIVKSAPEEKKALHAKRDEKKARDGPSKYTSSQTQTPIPNPPAQAGTTLTTGRLQQPISVIDSPSCPIEVSEGPDSFRGTGTCDDSSDESIAPPTSG